MSTETTLVEIPAESALQVYTTPGAIEPFLAIVKGEVDKFGMGDVSTKKGRDAIASFAHKLAKTRTFLDDKIGKALSAEAKDIPRKIDATRKHLRETLEGWQTEVRAPLTAWEEAEEARVNGIKAALAQLEAAFNDQSERPSASILARMVEITNAEYTAEAYGEYHDAALELRAKVLNVLEQRYKAAEKREADAAELAQLRAQQAAREEQERQAKAEQDRKDNEARIAREAAEKATREAEEQARQQQEATAKALRDAEEAGKRMQEAAALREQELAAQAERERQAAAAAEQRALDAEKAAKVKAEREQAEKAAAEKAEAEARERNRKHRSQINNAAKAALVAAGIEPDTAQKVVELIAKKAVPNCVINY